MQIVGFNKFTSKSGGKFAKLFVTEPFSAYEMQGGTCFGTKCREIFVSDEALINKLQTGHVGKEISPVYAPDNFGKAVLVDFSIKQ